MNVDFTEIFGAALGLTAIWLATRENPLYWVLSIFSVILYGFVLYSHKLYSDVLLHVFYLVFSFYGFIKWVKKDSNNKILQVSTLAKKTLALHLAVIFIGTVMGAFLFHKYTDASAPIVDNFCTCASLMGTYWQSRKKIENWPLWIVINSVYVVLFFYKGLYITSGLYAIYALLALEGLRKWKKSLIKI